MRGGDGRASHAGWGNWPKEKVSVVRRGRERAIPNTRFFSHHHIRSVDYWWPTKQVFPDRVILFLQISFFCFMVFLLPPSQLCHPLSLSPLSTLLLVCWRKIQSIFLLKLLQLLSLLQLLQVAPRGCYSIAGAGSNCHLTADADMDDVDADADMADVDADADD